MILFFRTMGHFPGYLLQLPVVITSPVMVVHRGAERLVLMLRLAWLQISATATYETLSRRTAYGPIPPRGLILDRNGVWCWRRIIRCTRLKSPEQVDDMNILLDQPASWCNSFGNRFKNFRRQLRERPRFEALTLRQPHRRRGGARR